MSLEQAAYLSQVIAGLTVLASLIFVGIQNHSEGVKNGWWPYRRNAYSPEFQAHLERSEKRVSQMGPLYELFGPAVQP